MTEKIITTIPKNSKEEIRVSLDEFNGHKLLNLRIWYRADDGEMRPGKSGLAFRVEHTIEVRDALNTAIEEAREIGWLG